jgi:hypothetical protein
VKRILFHFPGLGEEKLFDPNARDNCLEPFIRLREALRERGYELLTADGHEVEGCEWVWFWDVPATSYPVRKSNPLLSWIGSLLRRGGGRRPRTLVEECIDKGMQNRMALFLGEPPVVSQLNWDVEAHKAFRVIFTWDDTYVDGVKYHKFNYTMPEAFLAGPNVPFRDKKLLVNISGNKFSSHPQELYSARRATIRYFEQNHPEKFDLYGTGWNQPEYDSGYFNSYRGTVRHKWEVYPHYRFGLCYENTLGSPGYITEKIFDCMRAGCVPVYWGAPNIDEYVDEGTFIDRGVFDSDAGLAEFLLSVGEREYEQMCRAINTYLASERFSVFMPSALAETIINTLGL